MPEKIIPISQFEPLQWQIAPWRDISNVMLLTGSAGGGKALSVDTEIPTTTGWKLMRDVAVGDYVFDPTGKQIKVTAISDISHNSTCYKFLFDNNESIVSDANHLWYVHINDLNNSGLVVCSNDIDILLNYSDTSVYIPTLNNGPVAIIKCTQVAPVPVKCIEVESDDGLYLCTRSYITTHNSRLAAEKVHAFLQKYPGATGLIIRKVRVTLTNSVLAILKTLVIHDSEQDIEDINVQFHAGDGQYRYSNGSTLIFAGLEDHYQRTRLRSIGMRGGVDICWMEEATEFVEEDFNAVLTRMRGTAAPWRQVILTTNPDSPTHWIYQRIILNKEGSVYYSRADDNLYNPDDYIQTLSSTTGIDRARMFEGKWVQASGSIYTDFSPGVHMPSYMVRQTIPNTWRFVAGVDWGFRNPGVFQIWAFDSDDRAYLVHEVFRTEQTPEWWISRAIELHNRYNTEVWYCDPAEPQFIEMLLNAGVPAQPAFNDVLPGIGVIKDRLKVQADGRPRLYICRDALEARDPLLDKHKTRRPCGLAEELPGYVYKPNPKGGVNEVPLKENDHACFPTGTMIYTIDGSKPIESITTSDFVLTRSGFKRVLEAGITSTRRKLCSYTLKNGINITSTTNHPYAVITTSKERGASSVSFIPVKSIRTNRDKIYTLSGAHFDNTLLNTHVPAYAEFYSEYTYIKSKTQLPGFHTVYNLQVEDSNEYFANSVLVHNCDAMRYALASSGRPRMLNLTEKSNGCDISNGHVIIDNGTVYNLEDMIDIGFISISKRTGSIVRIFVTPDSSFILADVYQTQNIGELVQKAFDSHEIRPFFAVGGYLDVARALRREWIQMDDDNNALGKSSPELLQLHISTSREIRQSQAIARFLKKGKFYVNNFIIRNSSIWSQFLTYSTESDDARDALAGALYLYEQELQYNEPRLITGEP